MTIESFVTVINIFLACALVVGGLFAWRRVYSRAIADVQDRVIAVQKGEIEALTMQVSTLQREVTRLRGTLATVRYVLRGQGTDMIIEDEYVTLRTKARPKSTTIRIRRSDMQEQVERRDSDIESDDENPPDDDEKEAV